jgi:hypothetical protein
MNHWEEDPDFPLVDWRHEVADDNTRLGYRDWVHHQRVVTGAEIVVAAQRFVDAWADYAAYDNAGHMTQTEMETMADLMTACGEPRAATGLMEAWVESEIEDGECDRGDWLVTDFGNGPVLVDTHTVQMTCATCGRVGNRDDGIEIGGPCQEPCTGTIIRYKEGAA